jgi:DNA-binding transcriptional regulator YiaG
MDKKPIRPLDDYLRKSGVSDLALAKVVGASLARVRLWRTGRRWPNVAEAAVLTKELGIPRALMRPGRPAAEATSALDEHMIRTGVTTTALAARMQVTPSTVRQWRSGVRKTSVACAKRLAAELDMPLHLLRPDIWDAPPQRRQAPRAAVAPTGPPDGKTVQDCAA